MFRTTFIYCDKVFILIATDNNRKDRENNPDPSGLKQHIGQAELRAHSSPFNLRVWHKQLARRKDAHLPLAITFHPKIKCINAVRIQRRIPSVRS